jgi:hypothetical protein
MMEEDDSSSSDEEMEVGKASHGGPKVVRHDLIMKPFPDVLEDTIAKKGFFKSTRTR